MTVACAPASRHRCILTILALMLFVLALAIPTHSQRPVSGPGHGADPVAVLAQQPLPHIVSAQPNPLADLPEAVRVPVASAQSGELVVAVAPRTARRPLGSNGARAPPVG